MGSHFAGEKNRLHAQAFESVFQNIPGLNLTIQNNLQSIYEAGFFVTLTIDQIDNTLVEFNQSAVNLSNQLASQYQQLIPCKQI